MYLPHSNEIWYPRAQWESFAMAHSRKRRFPFPLSSLDICVSWVFCDYLNRKNRIGEDSMERRDLTEQSLVLLFGLAKVFEFLLAKVDWKAVMFEPSCQHMT